MVDIETHRTVDLLQSRKADEVSKWLQTFPNIEIVSRDGSVTYKNAIATAFPNAIQISDRFHLFKNLIDYAKDYLKKSMKAKVVIPATVPASTDESTSPATPADANRRLTLYQKYQQISTLVAEGLNQTQICKRLNMDVRVYKKLSVLSDEDAVAYFRNAKSERSQEKILAKLALMETRLS